jgi:hypothetical protein
MRHLIIVLAILVLGVTYTSPMASAQNTNVPAKPPQTNSVQDADKNKGLVPLDQPVKLTFDQLFNRFVAILLALAATIATIFIIVGGYKLVMSRGNTEAVTSGKKTITWAIVGLIVALMTFAIIRFVDQLIFP